MIEVKQVEETVEAAMTEVAATFEKAKRLL